MTTDLTRRSLIGAGTAAVAVSTVGGVAGPVALVPGAANAVGPTYTAAESLYQRPRFAALRGKGFSLVRNRVGTPVTLREVADLAGAPAGAVEQFQLTFTCRGALPEQGTYSLRRSGFTATSLFVVPDPARNAVMAIVNSSR